jgi:hypothetical protein
MRDSRIFDVMVDAEFEQMVAEVCHYLGKPAVTAALVPICGSRHPLEMNREERTAFLLPLSARCMKIEGGYEGGGHG